MPRETEANLARKADGIEVGHVLALYTLGGTVRDASKPRNARDARIQLPDERAGTLMVFQAHDRLSFALVMDATADMRVGDIVKNP